MSTALAELLEQYEYWCLVDCDTLSVRNQRGDSADIHYAPNLHYAAWSIFSPDYPVYIVICGGEVLVCRTWTEARDWFEMAEKSTMPRRR